jgi:hypothetical protein
MTDKREAILAQLGTVLTALVTDETFFFRNALEVPENKRPSIILNDADDTLDERLNPYGKGKPPVQGIPVSMTPEVFVLLADGGQDDIGPQLNDWRAKVIKAVLSDATLKGLCHEIQYLGFTSALANGRTMEGQAKLTFAFV